MAAPAWNDRTEKTEIKLGAGRIVTEDYEDVPVKLDYNADDNLGGFDRFGRVADQLWQDDSGTPTAQLRSTATLTINPPPDLPCVPASWRLCVK
ncbi:MAG TPA: hypothetical protein DD670_03480, partial [Planctomycetaceae bacterium]|nr:hypothetical protein [Planctomycetaceae bacterium]